MLNTLKKTWGFWLLLATLGSRADVLIDVSATMIAPACEIYSEHTVSPPSSLDINLGPLNLSEVGTAKAAADFPLYIQYCNNNQNLSIILNPKGTGVLSYQGRNILATNIEGLGVDFIDTTNGRNQVLSMNQKQRIYPDIEQTYRSRLDIRAQVVSAIPVNQLESGEFMSTVTLIVIYD